MRLKAEFFVDEIGIVTIKAKPIDFKIRKSIFERDQYRCIICGRNVKLWGNTYTPWEDLPGAVDHILPRSRGGQNIDKNLRLLCIRCNASRGAAINEVV